MSDYIRQGFIRQRRNIIIISLVVLLAEISDIQINKINIFGNEVLINNPNILHLFLWIALFYWLIRYYQYFRDIPDKGFKATFNGKLEQYAQDIAFNKTITFYNNKTENDETNQKKAYPRQFDIYRKSNKGFEGKVDYLIGTDPYSGGSIEELKVNITFKELIIPKIRSASNLILHTHLLTEYILPFIIVAIPIIYKLHELIVGF